MHFKLTALFGKGTLNQLLKKYICHVVAAARIFEKFLKREPRSDRGGLKSLFTYDMKNAR